MRTEPNSLLDNVLAEDAGFRADSLALTLGAVRHRRRVRGWRRAGASLAVGLLLGLTVWRSMVPAPVVSPSVASVSAFASVVTSGPLAANERVASAADGLDQVSSIPTGVEWVETAAQTAAYGVLSDDDLLDLAGGHAVVLVKNDGETRLLLDETVTLKWFDPQ
jgi:hypothetical protein